MVQSTLVGFVLLLALATTTAHAGSVIPRDSNVMDVIAPHTREFLPNRFNLLSWNVHKGSQGNVWAKDFYSITAKADLVLLQEAMKDNFMPVVLKNVSSFGWLFATSWINTPEMHETGVSTGSPARGHGTFRRSPGREPFARTPKMTLVSTYNLENGANLMVVNIHGINFVSVPTYQAQINDLIPIMQKHSGPIVFAGDFNTWNEGRMAVAMKAAKKLGMNQVHFPGDNRATKFDHIFVKGCVFTQGKLLTNIKSSDHPPLAVTVDCTSTNLR